MSALNQNKEEGTFMFFNTGESDESLKGKYNPEGSTLRNVQYRLLEMMKYLASVCDEIGVEFRLDGGNVLGAIRHGGFIPWDDDVDVVIRKEDEKKLCDYLLKHPHKQFVLQNHETDPNFYNPWIVLRDLKSEYIQDAPMHNVRKYRGAQIDIFTEQRGTIALLFFIAKKITALNNNYLVGRVRFIPDMIFFLQQKLIHPAFTMISNFFGSKNRSTYSYGIYWWQKYPQEVLYPYQDLSYEGLKFPGPADPKQFLKIKFGDNWMNLPPEESRNHHEANYRIEM